MEDTYGKEKVNQIDHDLIDARHASCILDVRTYRGANIDSDHYLVTAKVRSRISMARTCKPKVHKINLEALQQSNVAEAYAEEISLKLHQLRLPMQVDEHWQKCAEIINNAATTHLKHGANRSKNKWYDDECEAVCSVKNQARRKMLQSYTRSNKEEYRQRRKEAYKLIRRKKRQQKIDDISKLENLRNQQEIRKFYKSLNKQRKGAQTTSAIVKDRNGGLITNIPDVLNRWVEHFDELLNGNNSSNPHPLPTIHGPNQEATQPPSLEEVKSTIRRLKNHKSPGSDGIAAEMLKSGGDVLAKHIYEIITDIWRNEALPGEWNESIVCPIYKKGDQKECKNYRGISILNSTYKIFSMVLCEKLKPYVTSTIGRYQCGFMPNRSTTDQIFTLRQILEKTHEYNTTTHHLFIDFKQAYDSIDRSERLLAMKQLGILPKLINLCMMTISNTRVRVAKEISEVFMTKRGVKQGDGLSCDLFNMCLEFVIRRAGIETEQSSTDPYNRWATRMTLT